MGARNTQGSTGDYNSEESTVLDYDTNVEPKQSFEPLPDGDYVVNITRVAIKPTKKEGGKRVSVELAVDDGDHAGRRVFVDFNVVNANPTAQEIGRREYAGLLHAAGMVGERDAAKLVGVQVVATVRTQAASGGYDARNIVKKFAPAGGGAKSAPPSAAPKTQPAKAPPAFMKPTLAK